MRFPAYVAKFFKERKAGMDGPARGPVFTDHKGEIRLISNIRRSLGRHSSSAITREFDIQEELQMVDNRAVFDDAFPPCAEQ